MEQSISGYWNNLLRQFYKNLHKASLSTNNEAIHDFRIALKRIFAIAHFLKANMVKVPNLGYAKTIFKKGGKIRDLQVLHITAKAHLPVQDFQTLNHFLTTEYKNKQEDFLSFLRDRNLYDNSLEQTTVLEDFFLHKRLPLYLQSTSLKVTQWVESSDPTSHFHNCRRLIKRQLYLMTIFNEIHPKSYKKEKLSKLKYLEQQLGNWHDLEVLEDLTLKFQSVISNKGQQTVKCLKKETEKELLPLLRQYCKNL